MLSPSRIIADSISHLRSLLLQLLRFDVILGGDIDHLLARARYDAISDLVAVAPVRSNSQIFIVVDLVEQLNYALRRLRLTFGSLLCRE